MTTSMTKIVLLIAVLVAVLINTASAANVRRKTGGGLSRGTPKGEHNKRTTKHSPRQLAHRGFDPSQGKGKGSKGKGSKGMSKGGGGGMMQRPMCRPVVEGAEFIIEGAITQTMANMTEDASTIGTEFIYNGPLLEFNEDDELQELENFFLSGSCTRTQERDGDMPGAGHCGFTITLDTGATMNVAGEAFDGWDNLMAIDGGSQELIGLSGTVTLIGLNDNFEDTDDDFFSVPWIYGEAVLVYSVCPQGYWDRYYIENHDALPPPSIPDPFQRNAQVVPDDDHVHPHPPADDDDHEDDDFF